MSGIVPSASPSAEQLRLLDIRIYSSFRHRYYGVLLHASNLWVGWRRLEKNKPIVAKSPRCAAPLAKMRGRDSPFQKLRGLFLCNSRIVQSTQEWFTPRPHCWPPRARDFHNRVQTVPIGMLNRCENRCPCPQTTEARDISNTILEIEVDQFLLVILFLWVERISLRIISSSCEPVF